MKKRPDRRHAPRPLFSSRLKSKHHGFHRHPSLETLHSGRWLPSLGPALQFPLRVFTSPSPRLGFLVVVLVAPLVHGRFVSPLPRTPQRVSLSGLHGRKVYLPRQYVSLWAGGVLRSSALMAMLPGIALPPCSLGRCSAAKIRDPLAVGRVRTSRLVYDPSLTSPCGIPWLGYSLPSILGSHPTATLPSLAPF